MEEATTAKVYLETLKLFRKRPNVEIKNLHVQYPFIWSEFDLYPIRLESKEVWFRILHQVITVRQMMFELKIIEKNGMRNVILISEYLFLIWVKRRQLVFDKKQWRENEAIVGWEGKIKWAN
jgi:hypothetical protein